MHYDAIVVGAGPAGSSAAIQLARNNCTVLLLEKSKHPRYKSCGGGISVRLRPYLDPDFFQVVENSVNTLSIRYKDTKVVFSVERPFADLVRRERFDDYLVQKAKESGVEVLESSPVEAWHETSKGIMVESRSGKDTADFLIAADGANSRIARKLYPEWLRNQAPALEDTAPSGLNPATSKNTADGILLDLSVTQGYGWIFPKSETAAVGIGLFKGNKKHPRHEYADFKKRNMLPAASSACAQGAILPLYQKKRPKLVRGRVLLTGDAAALLDPFFGEGIYYGVRSGQMAAQAVFEALHHGGEISAYHDAIAAIFYPEFEVADRMARLIYTFPGFFLQTVRRYPGLMKTYAGVFQGEFGYCDFWKASRRRLFRKLNPFRRFSATSSQS